MGTLRTLGLVGLGFVLFVSLVSANAAVALDRTALDSEFAKDKAEETDLYETFTEAIRDDLAGGGSTNASEWPLDRSRDELVAAAITEDYVESQGEKNIDAVYAYLHGERDELRLQVDTEPVKENLIDEIEAEVEGMELTAVMPSAEEIEALPDSAGIEEMASSREAFEDARADFRAEQKARIQAETDRELSDEELEARLDATMDDVRDQMLANMDAQLEGQFEGSRSELEAPVRTLQTARIDALTGEMSYEEYRSTVETATDDLGDAFASVVEAQLEGNLPGTVDVTEQLNQGQRESLETARTGVSLVSTLGLVLPVFALVVAGAIGYVAARPTAALAVGVVSLIVGGIGVIGSTVAAGQFRETFDPANAPPGIGEFSVSFVTGTLGAVTRQSAVLAVVGAVAIAIGLAIRWGYLPEE